ncbi:VOC family protein [Massilia endophytica]|uniref:VOC family protein n=1 Tax=Massilia endophytica TaxID=2899220 RepID=UPI001E40BAD1|nr:VOC family protein [Massilia endophytica]UGQ45896.1 VOC family protein [Massilia endophytica]
MQFIPTIYLPGSCAAAISFYRNAIGAQLLSQLTAGPDSQNPGAEPKIIRAAMRIGEGVIYLSEGHHAAPAAFQGFSLALNVADHGEAERAMQALADGGTVQFPLRKTMLADPFGKVIDRFGVHWSVEVPVS